MERTIKYDVGDKVWPKDYTTPPKDTAIVYGYFNNHGGSTWYRISRLDSPFRECDLCTHEQWHEAHNPKLTPRELVAGDELVGIASDGGYEYRVFLNRGELEVFNMTGNYFHVPVGVLTPAYYTMARTGQPLADYLAGKPEPEPLPLLGGRKTVRAMYCADRMGGAVSSESIFKECFPDGTPHAKYLDYFLVTEAELRELMRR